MDFRLSVIQEDIKIAAREFAEKEFPQIAEECDAKEEFPTVVWKKACELGLVGPHIKEEYGGPGMGFFEAMLIMEEFWRVDPGVGNIGLAAFGSEIVQRFGTETQRRKYLPLIPAGQAIWGTAVTEPDAGSDIFSISTKARKIGDEYVVNGAKTFITNGSIAQILIVFCITNESALDRKKRFGLFIVETDKPGFEATKQTGKLGIRASDTAQISFNEMRIPKENLVGEVEGEGFRQIMYLFNIYRCLMAAQGVGVAQGAFEKALKHIKQRKAFGKTLHTFQGIQFMVADMATKIEAARNMVYKAGWLIDNGRADPKLISMAKLFAGEVALHVTNEALQLHGGYGYFAEYGVERLYRDAKIIDIYEGSREIARLTIAKEILGRDV